MANMIARLGVVLGLDNAEFVKGIEGASKKLDQFADSATKYGKMAATALVAASLAALKYADDLADVAKANDVAIDTIVKLREALAQNGGEAGNASKMLSSFTSYIDKAAGGSFEAQKNLSRLGVSFKDLGTLGVDELQGKVFKSLAGMEDPISRNAIAMELFGKAAKGVDWASFNDSMESTNTLARDQAKSIQQAADIFDKLAKSGRDFALMLTIQLGAPLNQTIEYMKSLSHYGQALGVILNATFKGAAATVMTLAFAYDRLTDALFGKQGSQERSKAEFERLKQELANLYRGPDLRMGMNDPRVLGGVKPPPGRATTLGVDPAAERAARERERLEKHFRDLQKAGLEDWKKTNQEVYENISRIEWLGEKMRVVQEEEGKRLELNRRMFEIDTNRERLRQEEVNYRKEVAQIEFDHARKLEEIQNSEMSLDDKKRARQTEEEQRLQRLTMAYAKMNAEIEKRQGSFSQGFVQKMGDFFRDMPTQLELGAQAFDSVFNSMSSALDNFVKTGKLSFKDLARSIIQDLLRIQLQAQISGLLSMFFRGSAATSQFSLATGMSSGLGLKLPGNANGGTVSADSPYIVGERGPELFVPRNSGSVIPNGAMGGSLGGTTNVTNNYIQAIDVQSFEQRLLGSSNTIWAANQYANKSLAVAGGRA